MSENTWKVATFNANSIRARLPIILAWLQQEAPDVLCIQETKAQDADFPAEPIREIGYHVVFRGRRPTPGSPSSAGKSRSRWPSA